MNRDLHSASSSPISDGGDSAAAPGKRTRTQGMVSGAAAPQAWTDLLGVLGVPRAPASPPGDDPFAMHLLGTAARAPASGPPIQRSQDPGREDTSSGACLDPEALLADLLRIAREVAVVRTAIDPAGAGGAGVADPAAATTTLRALTQQTEVLRPWVDGCGVAMFAVPLRAQFDTTQGALLACFQLLAVYHADQTLQAWDGATDEQQAAQRIQWEREAGNAYAPAVTQDWCGKFVNAQYRASGMTGAFRMAFNHVDNVAAFFSYNAVTPTERSPDLIRPHGAAPEAGIDLRGYHEERGSLRSWVIGEAIGNDLRAGDVVTLDWTDDGIADHINIVASYTPPTGTQPGVLTTIDGNAYGARKPGAARPAFDGAADSVTTHGDMTTNDVSTSSYQTTATPGTLDRSGMIPQANQDQGNAWLGATLFGRGRPSLVDFEGDHTYPDAPQVAVPAAAADPIQRSEHGAVATVDPAQAFTAATAGGGSAIPYRAEMEQRLGADFGSVQAYVGRDLTALGAHAAARSEQVAFTSATPDRELVAHELTHVVQSRQGRAGSAAVSDPGDASEHEARGVASAFAGGGAIAIGSAPSAAIHRDDDDGGTVPTPVLPEFNNRGGGPINFDTYNYIIGTATRLPAPNNGQPGTVREAYHFYLLRYLQLELPDLCTEFGAIPAETVDSGPAGRALRATAVEGLSALITLRMREHLGGPDPAIGRNLAEQIRLALFRANEHALADALQNETAERYEATRDANGVATETWCNVWAYDMVTAMGGYLPRQWWTPEAEVKWARNEVPGPGEVVQQRANDVYDWMIRWGDEFGWGTVDTAELAQASANAGRLVIILASTGNDDPGGAGPGHVSVVMAESTALGRVRPNAIAPLQSQAGAENFSSNAAGVDMGVTTSIGHRAWWEDSLWSDHANAGVGFFVYRGVGPARGANAIQTPEATGLVLPRPLPPEETTAPEAS